MPLVFSKNFAIPSIFALTEHTWNQFFKMFTWVLLVDFLDGFSKFWLFIVKICISILDFWVMFEIIACACWAYAETILSHTEHARKRFHRTLSVRWTEFLRMLSQRKNVNSFYMYIYAEHTGKWFYCTLSIRGNDLNGGWAYAEMISSLTEHTRKCLKVEYLGESNTIFKNLVWQALGTIRIRFLQKSQNFMLVYLLSSSSGMRFSRILMRSSRGVDEI